MTEGPRTPETSRGLAIPRSLLLALCLLGVVVGLIECAVELELRSTGAFRLYDVLYDTDAVAVAPVLANAWPPSQRIQPRLPNSVHPLLGYIPAPLLRPAAKLAALVGQGR